MKKGDLVTWIEPKHWPPHLINALEKYREQHGEGPFEIINVIQKPEVPEIIFFDKSGEEIKLCSLWFEIILLGETPNPLVH